MKADDLELHFMPSKNDRQKNLKKIIGAASKNGHIYFNDREIETSQELMSENLTKIRNSILLIKSFYMNPFSNFSLPFVCLMPNSIISRKLFINT